MSPTPIRQRPCCPLRSDLAAPVSPPCLYRILFLLSFLICRRIKLVHTQGQVTVGACTPGPYPKNTIQLYPSLKINALLNPLRLVFQIWYEWDLMKMYLPHLNENGLSYLRASLQTENIYIFCIVIIGDEFVHIPMNRFIKEWMIKEEQVQRPS